MTDNKELSFIYLLIKETIRMCYEKNTSGKPLSGSKWLQNHHQAKIPERSNFAKKLIELSPKKILDLGCATGLWLELFNKYADPECEFIGIDSDEESLKIAEERSKHWNRKVSFLHLDIEEIDSLPAADITLAFNIFPYIKKMDVFLDKLYARSPRGTLAIRQYDGDSIRFGPMPTSYRQQIEQELYLSTGNSNLFRHYDLDRTFSAVYNSPYSVEEIYFETFQRISPLDEADLRYFKDTIDWTCRHISNESSAYLQEWAKTTKQYYFWEVDAVVLLS